MFKKILSWLLIIIGFLYFLFVGGGSMRYRKRSIRYSSSINEDLILIGVLIATPIIGYFLIKLGFKILERNK